MSITEINTGTGKDLKAIFANDPDELLHMRERAYQAFLQLPAPDFDRSDLQDRIYDFAGDSTGFAGDWQREVEGFVDLQGDNPVLVFVDGEFVHSHGLEKIHPSSTVKNLRKAVQDESVLRELGSVIALDENKWLALQTAFWQDGAYIHFPKGVSFDGVIQIVHLTSQKGKGTFPRNLIIAETGSSLSVLDVYIANPNLEEELHLGITEVIAKDASRVHLGCIQNFPKKTTNYWVRRARVERDARVDFVIGEVGEGYTIGEFGSLLQGNGSASSAHAVALGTGRSHMDLTSKMVHIGKFSESDTSARGVMQGRSEAVYRGITHILKGASGSNGEQAEKLLMLSPTSRADAIPILLIDENDVKCGHAASVGQISEEQLFYLMSRGISEAAAKRIIVWGFLDPVLSAFGDARVRQAVEDILERKMV